MFFIASSCMSHQAWQHEPEKHFFSKYITSLKSIQFLYNNFSRAILQTFNGKNFKWTRLLSLKDATTDAANDYYYDEDVWQKLQKRTQPRDIYDLQATTGRHDGLVNHVASGAPPVSLLHKVLYSKYYNQWSHFMAFTMDCDCSEISIMV